MVRAVRILVISAAWMAAYPGLALPAEVVAECTIQDPNEQPLANASVTIFPMGREYRTNERGCVSIRYATPQDPRGLLAYVRHKTPAWVCGVWLPSGGGAVNVRLAEALSVTGRVTDPQGQPAGGVQIAALPMSNRYVRTDADGRFDIAWDPAWAGPLTDLCLMARDPDRNLAALAAITPQTRNADIVLEPGLTLTGMVESPNGKGIPGVKIRLALIRDWSCATPVEPVESDSQGRWQFTALPQRQEYGVSASATGYGSGRSTSGRINITGATAPVDSIVLKPRDRSVSGVVIDVNGLPVEGATVTLQGEGQSGQEAATDREGRFTLSEICDGTFDLFTVRDRDRRREGSGQVLGVRADGSHQEIVLFPERGRQKMREESPFEVDPQVGVLKYRWSDRGWRLLEGKDWQRIDMVANRPANVELPNPGYGEPLWGRWQSPAVKTGSRWIALTRAHARGQYDRLVMDTNGDGRFDDEIVLAAYSSSQPSEHSYVTAFGPAEVVLDHSSGPSKIHLNFGFYGSNRELIVGSIGWFEGDVDIAGEKVHCLLADKDANGTFATRSSDPMSADLMGLGDQEHRTSHVLGKYVAFADDFYEVRIAEGHERIRVNLAQAEDIRCGTVRLPESICEFTVAGEIGCFTLHPKDGIVRVPAGVYRIVRWRSERNDDQGQRWTLTGHSFDDAAKVEVAADGETNLAIGEPVLTSLQEIQGTAPPYRFNCPKLTGRWGETVDLDSDGPAARLLLHIKANDESYDRTFTFEYG